MDGIKAKSSLRIWSSQLTYNHGDDEVLRINSMDRATAGAVTKCDVGAITGNGEVPQAATAKGLEEGCDHRIGKCGEQIDILEQGRLDLTGYGIEERLQEEAEVAIGGGAETVSKLH